MLKKTIGLLFFSFSLFIPLPGREQVFHPDPAFQIVLPENKLAREEYKDLIFSGANIARQSDNHIIKQQDRSDSVLFKLKEDTDNYYLLFINQAGAEFPLLNKGNFSIKKSKANGDFQYLTILLRSTNDSYIRIAPFNERSRLDIVLYGALLYRNINVPVPFKKIVTASFAGIKELTESFVDWSMLLYQRQSERDIFIAGCRTKIRRVLPFLKDADDGSYNADGAPVYIADESSQGADGGLNCAGFAKWIVDGFYYAAAESFMDVGMLKRRLLQLRGTRWSKRYEQARDPYFGLDWTRNLAAVLYETEQKHTVTDYQMFDVRDIPFFPYTEDIGYRVLDLKILLYLLTVEKPGRIYLGSVNGQWGKEPVLRQHFHIAVLLPYFDEEGSFQITVFERNTETSVDSLVKRYPGDYIHLVQINTGMEFADDYAALFTSKKNQ